MPEIGALLQAVAGVTMRRPRILPALNDTCSCHKGPDGYGREGWHLRRYSEADIEREAAKSVASLPPHVTPDARQAAAASARDLFARYVGLPVAYERCPAYMAEVDRQIKERRANEAKGKSKGRNVLGDDL